MNTVTIEPMRPDQAEAVLRIYRLGIAQGDATLETRVPEWAVRDAAHLSDHRFVALDAEAAVVGWVDLVVRERMGPQGTRWRDVVLVERRSRTVE